MMPLQCAIYPCKFEMSQKMGYIKKEKQKEFETSQRIGAMEKETNRQKLIPRDAISGASHYA